MRILLIFLSVVCIAVMQFGSVPGGDELSYAFEGQRDGQVAAPRRVESFLYGCLLLWWFVYYSEIGGRNLPFLATTLAGNEASFTTKTGERVTIYTK